MPAWTTIQLTDLNDYLAAAQVNALNTAALPSGTSGRFDRLMPDMVNRIRTRIESCPRNHLSATPLTVPPELKWAACYLIIDAMQSAVPAIALTNDQRAQIARANDQLNRVSAGLEAVSIPDDPLTPADVQRSGQTRLVTSTPRELSRRQTKNL